MLRTIWVLIVSIAEIACILSAIGICLNGGTIAEITAGVCAGVVALYLQRYRESLETPINFKTLEKIRDAFKKDSD